MSDNEQPTISLETDERLSETESELREAQDDILLLQEVQPTDLNDFRLISFHRNRLYMNEEPYLCTEEWLLPEEECRRLREKPCEYTWEERSDFWKKFVIKAHAPLIAPIRFSETGLVWFAKSMWDFTKKKMKHNLDHACNSTVYEQITRSVYSNYVLAMSNVAKQTVIAVNEPRAFSLRSNHGGMSKHLCDLALERKIGMEGMWFGNCPCFENTWSGFHGLTHRSYCFNPECGMYTDTYHTAIVEAIHNCLLMFASPANNTDNAVLSCSDTRFQIITPEASYVRMQCVRRIKRRIWDLFPVLKNFINVHEVQNTFLQQERLLCELYLDSIAYNDRKQHQFAIAWEHFDFYEYLTDHMLGVIAGRIEMTLNACFQQAGLGEEESQELMDRVKCNDLIQLNVYRVFSDSFEVLDRHDCSQCNKKVLGGDIRLAALCSQTNDTLTVAEMYEYEYNHSLVNKNVFCALPSILPQELLETFNLDLPDWKIFTPTGLPPEEDVIRRMNLTEIQHICVECLAGEDWFYLVGDKGTTYNKNNLYRGWYMHKSSLKQFNLARNATKSARF